MILSFIFKLDRIFKVVRYFIIAVIVQILWSIAASASNYVITRIPVEVFIATRWILTGTLFLSISSLMGNRIRVPIKEGAGLILLGFIGFCLGSIGTLHALRLGGIVNFAFLTSIYPVLVGLVCIVVLKEKIRKSYLIAVPLTVIGMIVLSMGKLEISGLSIAMGATLLVIMAGLCEGITFAYSKKRNLQTSLLTYMGYTQLGGGAIMAIFLLSQGKSLSVANLDLMGTLSFLYVAIVSGMICYGVLCWLLKKMDGHRLALFDGLHAIFGSFFGWLIFSETINLTMIFGAILLLTSLYIANSSRFENIGMKKRTLSKRPIFVSQNTASQDESIPNLDLPSAEEQRKDAVL